MIKPFVLKTSRPPFGIADAMLAKLSQRPWHKYAEETSKLCSSQHLLTLFRVNLIVKNFSRRMLDTICTSRKGKDAQLKRNARIAFAPTWHAVLLPLFCKSLGACLISRPIDGAHAGGIQVAVSGIKKVKTDLSHCLLRFQSDKVTYWGSYLRNSNREFEILGEDKPCF